MRQLIYHSWNIFVHFDFFAVYKSNFLVSAVYFPITDHVMFSRILFFYSSKAYSFIYRRLIENLKANILKTIMKWSEMEQQTTQDRNVYSNVLSLGEEIITFLILKLVFQVLHMRFAMPFSQVFFCNILAAKLEMLF